MTLMKFWGKSDPAGGTAYKPVLHHLIDVAAVALRLQETNRARTTREAVVLGVSPEILTKISAYLAGLHDLGKFSRSFQAKRPDLWPTDAFGPMGQYTDRGHWRNTAVMLRAPGLHNELAALFPNLEDGLAVLIDSVAGHHGRPPSEVHLSSPRRIARDNEIGGACLEAALEAMQVLRGLIAPEPVKVLEDPEQCQIWSWRLAGLTTLADWIGSDSGFFAFEDPDMPIETYWPMALERADRAIAAKGLGHLEVRSKISLAVLAPQISAPRPMQVMAEEAAIADGPQLMIIEDTTGSGKTEAALVLAGRMMVAGKGEGIYFALPTMATANAMYDRFGDIHHRLFADGAQPSLVLAHGKASLSPDFLASRGRTLNGASDEEDNTATYCAEWIADNRRKAFFANVGAGTIDQAFLAVLKKKFLTLRQQGLAGRILIVDEAHAFDAYMSRELETLLEAHAALGSSAIILSATLPSAKRQEIVKAFSKGLGATGPSSLKEDHYPLLTSVSRQRIDEQRVDFCESLRREVTVERLPDAAAAHEEALSVARKGAAVLVIRNAVDEVIASYEALSVEHPDTHLFHARFAMCDRQRIEQDVLARFGRDAMPQERAGHILAASQVVEQSLDLDFDLVISDLAPVDLIIQRAGRLWRHMDRRPAGERPIARPRIQMIAPDPAEATHENWLEPALGIGAFVYRHPGVMYRSAAALLSAGAIKTPDNLRALIAHVYEDDNVPECLERGQNEAEGQKYGHRTHAGTNLIDFTAGYTELGDLASDQEIGTRLGEEMVTLRLARRVGDKLVPWAAGEADAAQSEPAGREAWALSEVSVRKKWLGDTQPPEELEPLIAAARKDWPKWDQTMIAVVGEDGHILLDCEEVQLQYSSRLGLLRLK